jgi:hypothetical protein
MKLLCKIVLEEYGFTQLHENAGQETIMSKGSFKLSLNPDGTCTYFNLGIAYPVKDLTGLKKLFKEVRGQELKEVKEKAH